MLREIGYRWDSHPGRSCLGCSRRHSGAIGEDLRAVSRGLVLLRRQHRQHQQHQLLLPLCDRVVPACSDGDEGVKERGRIPSRSRTGPYYERLQCEVSGHGLNKTRGNGEGVNDSFLHCGPGLPP